MVTRNEVKQWFQTLDKPTQAQFWALFDSIYFQEDGIEMADINGLVAALAGKTPKADFDAHVKGELIEASDDVIYGQLANYLIEKIIIIPGADCNITIGTTNGGEEVLPGTEILVDEPDGYVVVINAFSPMDRDLYINGIPANSKLIVLKRLLKVQ